MRSTRLLAAATVAAALVLTGCGAEEDTETSTETSTDTSTDTAGTTADAASFPVTIEHAYGETTIEQQPERVATVAWMNHEVPLALGVVPVGMSKATWGDDDGDGVLPWVSEQLDELGAESPVLFDETEGIDFEAVADTAPDVILASYSGLSQEDYDTLSKIAPTIAYPDVAWGTSYQQMIEMNSEALGLGTAGQDLVDELDQEVTEDFAEHPDLQGANVLFAYLDAGDLSQIGFYTTNDTRPGFLAEYGMGTPAEVAEVSAGTDEFYTTISAEQADLLDDVDLIVTYGDQALVDQVEADPLLSKIPAVAAGHLAVLPDSTPLAALANPTPLGIGWGLEDYLDLLAAPLEQG